MYYKSVPRHADTFVMITQCHAAALSLGAYVATPGAHMLNHIEVVYVVSMFHIKSIHAYNEQEC